MARSWPRAAFMRRSGHTSPAASSPAKEPRLLKPRHNRSRIEDRGSRIEDRGSRIEDRGSRIEDRGSRIEDRGSRIEDRMPSLIAILYLLSSILDPRSWRLGGWKLQRLLLAQNDRLAERRVGCAPVQLRRIEAVLPECFDGFRVERGVGAVEHADVDDATFWSDDALERDRAFDRGAGREFDRDA